MADWIDDSPADGGRGESCPRSRHCGQVAYLAAQPLIWCIYVYRFTLSPFVGNSCRFWPTCSHYAEQALRRWGAWRGSIAAAKRVLRCHPWHEGGYDPVE